MGQLWKDEAVGEPSQPITTTLCTPLMSQQGQYSRALGIVFTSNTHFESLVKLLARLEPE
jgi:3-dehydroquinate dehydratase